MGAPFVALSLVVVLTGLLFGRNRKIVAFAVAASCSAAFYPFTIVAGILSGSLAALAESVLPMVLVGGVAMGLSCIAAALAGETWGSRQARDA